MYNYPDHDIEHELKIVFINILIIQRDFYTKMVIHYKNRYNLK